MQPSSLSSLTSFFTSDTFLSTVILAFLSVLTYKLFPYDILPTLELLSGQKSPNDEARAAHAFRSYRALSMAELSRMQRSYAKIGRAHKRIGYDLGYPAKLRRLADTIEVNSKLANAIADSASAESRVDLLPMQSASESDLRDVREALRHLVRDWSSEGAEERTQVMDPLIRVLSEIPLAERASLKVLVPGSGLGRLAWEINKLGFKTTADELSPFMNLTFRFLLSPSSTHEVNQHTLHPYSSWFSHQRSNDHLFRSVAFPDELPFLSPTFRHITDDFFSLSPSSGHEYGYVVTQFFIDTSTNIISTLQQIHALLKPGGTWINLGPLLWRGGARAALELSLDEVLTLAKMVGFEVQDGDEKRKTVESEYTADRSAMMKWIYLAELWVAKKAL